MKYNLDHFSELMETQLTEEVKEIGKRSDILYSKHGSLYKKTALTYPYLVVNPI